MPIFWATLYTQASSREPDALTDLAATRKEAQYSMPTDTHVFEPLAFECHCRLNATAISLLQELGHRTSQRSVDDRETQLFLQRLSVVLQKFKAVLFGESFLAAIDDPHM